MSSNREINIFGLVLVLRLFESRFLESLTEFVNIQIFPNYDHMTFQRKNSLEVRVRVTEIKRQSYIQSRFVTLTLYLLEIPSNFTDWQIVFQSILSDQGHSSPHSDNIHYTPELHSHLFQLGSNS